MTEPTISLRDVKARVTRRVGPLVPFVTLTVPERDALVEAVEAAHGPIGQWTREGEDATKRLNAALARFSDVGTEAGT